MSMRSLLQNFVQSNRTPKNRIKQILCVLPFDLFHLRISCCCRNVHEKEVKNLNNEIRDIQRRNEMLLNEISEMKVQMKVLEENRDTLRHDLLEANRKLREGLCY